MSHSILPQVSFELLEPRRLLSGTAAVMGPMLSAAGVAPSEIDLRWTNPMDPAVRGFAVERSQGDQPFTQVASLTPAAVSYADQRLPALASYRYRVREDLSDGTSLESNVVSAMTLPASLGATVGVVPPYVDQTSGAPTPPYVVNGVAYFFSRDETDNRKLWRTDGTAGGTYALSPAIPEDRYGQDSFFTVAGVTYLATSDTLYNFGGAALKPLMQYGPIFNPVRFTTEYAGLLYFVGLAPASSNWALFKSDGTPSGTSVVRDFGSLPSQLVVAGDRLFFGQNFSFGTLPSYSLWVSDGTPAGTKPLAVSSIHHIFPAADRVYVTADGLGGPHLWTSDGTAAGTVELTTDPTLFPDPNNVQATTIGNELYFFAPAGANHTEHLWRSDGTPQGTQPYLDLNLDPSQMPDRQHVQLTAIGSSLYFFAPSGANGATQLWRSDGTAEGSQPLGTLTGTAPVAATSLFSAGQALYFSAVPQDQSRTDVWTSDGTPAGTQIIRSIETGTTAGVTAFSEAGGTVYFVADDKIAGWQLWNTAGTPDSTALLASFKPTFTGDNGAPTNFTPLGSRLLFSADDGTHGRELWESDGSVAGTAMVKDIGYLVKPAWAGPMIGTDAGSAYLDLPVPGDLWRVDGTSRSVVKFYDGALSGLFNAAGTVYFGTGIDSPLSLETTDGTAAGTRSIAPISTTGGVITPLGVLGGRYFFVVEASNTPTLWVTDGTSAGTHPLLNQSVTRPDPSFDPYVSGTSGGYLYYVTYAPAPAGSYPPLDQVWRTDGTDAGTTKLGEFSADPSDIMHFGITDVNATAFVAADGRQSRFPTWQLFKSSAGDSHLVPVATFLAGGQVANLNGVAYFPAEDASGWGLWRSDGTPEGTILVTPLVAAGDVRETFSVNGLLFIEQGTSLYRSDGTAAGTYAVHTFRNAGSFTGAAVVGDRLIFADPTTLWATDGTTAGTYEVDSSVVVQPFVLAPAGDRFYYLNGPDSSNQYLVKMGSLAALDAPAGLTAVATPASVGTSAAVSLSWQDTQPDAAGYLVERSTHPDFATIDQNFYIPAGMTALTDMTAIRSANYYYRVRAVDAGGNSAPSGAASVQFAAIRGSAFNDANHNGTADAGESGAAGVTVFIDANGNGLLDPGEISTLTDAAGNYVLGGLGQGAYAVREVPPVGTRRTTPIGAPIITATRGLSTDGPIFGNVATSTVPMDFSFLLTLAQHYNQAGTFAAGDVTGDDTINFDDLLVLAQNYGHALPATAAAAGDSASWLLKKRNR